MNALNAKPPTFQYVDTWLSIAPGRELVVSSPDHLVDVADLGLAYPVLSIHRDAHSVEDTHLIYQTSVTWVLPNGNPAGQVRMDLVSVNGRFTSLIKRHPRLAPWASALLSGARRAPALCKAAFQSWEAEVSALTLVGRVHHTELAKNVQAEDVYQPMLAHAMQLVAEVVEHETGGRARVRFTVQDLDEGSCDQEERMQAGHESRGRRRSHFERLGLVPAQPVDPARLGIDDDFDGDHPEIFLVPLSNPQVYPIDDEGQTLPNPLNLVSGKPLKSGTDDQHFLPLAPNAAAVPTVYLSQLTPGSGADCQVSVQWMYEGETVATVGVRLFEATENLGEVLRRHPEVADWMSTIAKPTDTSIRLRPLVNSAWGPTAQGTQLIGRVTLVKVERELYRPKLVLDTLLMSLRVVRDIIALRTFHQRTANFTVEPSTVLSPEDGHVTAPDHVHLVEIARMFSAAGFAECSPHIQGLFQPRSLQVRLERAPVFAVPHHHPVLAPAGRRTLH